MGPRSLRQVQHASANRESLVFASFRPHMVSGPTHPVRARATTRHRIIVRVFLKLKSFLRTESRAIPNAAGYASIAVIPLSL